MQGGSARVRRDVGESRGKEEGCRVRGGQAGALGGCWGAGEQEGAPRGERGCWGAEGGSGGAGEGCRDAEGQGRHSGV